MDINKKQLLLRILLGLVLVAFAAFLKLTNKTSLPNSAETQTNFASPSNSPSIAPFIIPPREHEFEREDDDY